MANLSLGFAQPPEAGCVYLTFDDGPDARWTPRILDLLAQANVRATFFVVGRCSRRRRAKKFAMAPPRSPASTAGRRSFSGRRTGVCAVA